MVGEKAKGLPVPSVDSKSADWMSIGRGNGVTLVTSATSTFGQKSISQKHSLKGTPQILRQFTIVVRRLQTPVDLRAGAVPNSVHQVLPKFRRQYHLARRPQAHRAHTQLLGQSHNSLSPVVATALSALKQAGYNAISQPRAPCQNRRCDRDEQQGNADRAPLCLFALQIGAPLNL